MRQDFVFIQDDISLRSVVAQVRLALGNEMPNWGRYFVLFRHNDAYACTGLGALSDSAAKAPRTTEAAPSPTNRFTAEALPSKSRRCQQHSDLSKILPGPPAVSEKPRRFPR